jgi:hypothetical protein
MTLANSLKGCIQLFGRDRQRRGLAAALTAAAAMCVQEDLQQVCRAWRLGGKGVPLTAWVSGDAYSSGGALAFEALQSIAQLGAELNDDVPLEVAGHWGT